MFNHYDCECYHRDTVAKYIFREREREQKKVRENILLIFSLLFHAWTFQLLETCSSEKSTISMDLCQKIALTIECRERFSVKNVIFSKRNFFD